jgi:hypothetical protein
LRCCFAFRALPSLVDLLRNDGSLLTLLVTALALLPVALGFLLESLELLLALSFALLKLPVSW